VLSQSTGKIYPDTFPVRENIKVGFKNPVDESATGVVANVIGYITGATDVTGFKGIAGKFIRHSLMNFDVSIEGQIKFIRTDNNQSGEVIYNPIVPPEPEM